MPALTGHHAAGRAWLALAALAAAGSLLAWFLPAAWLDWQPDLAASQPWRAITAACVHWSPRHLAANLAGAAVLAAVGWAGRLPAAAALAWALAWPLTQAGLLLRPDLAHYGGLSGVLHAGVAVAALWLMFSTGERRQRWIGAGIALGLLAKLLIEAPWGATLRQGPEWDIAIAPLAHATGAISGVLTAAAVAGLGALRQRGR